ncbi:CaiB/BaiF CoA transferase family protein [Alicyclobacillus ferrooxydans]|uniref:CoA-transferase n=1 Tax=Alicyclobacillus ferrooxydans TaxID=471514 RepID=A0A0P9CHB0_9BACL|nr:CaiB/BaiF CoA-transferase family protein [Alicyclobacillus ferrooxydans]KPV42432.1 CoA-transferase [Alicyclobacillus ferrooxydans]
MGPLNDIRVIEIGSLLAGPFTGRLLGDFGAEVIKIETPDKEDTMRRWGQRVGEDGILWPVMSRNKKSITLNLREREGQAIFLDLVKKSDVVLENFRPGTLEKWGLDYETLKTVNPRVILLRTSGFGQTGPYSSQAGFGSVGEAMGGIRYVTGYPDRPPTRIGISIGDSLAAVFATIGCLMALHERERSGLGQVVDTAIYEAVFTMMEGLVPEYQLTGFIRERTGNTIPGVAPANIYETKDGSHVVMGANANNVFARLAQAMGRGELATDARFSTHIARGENQEELDSMVNEWTKQHDSSEVLNILHENGVPAGKIYNAKDIIEDEHYRARDMILSMIHPTMGEFKMPGIVPKLSRTPGEVKWVGPTTMGEHNAEVYGDLLGISTEEMQRLKEAKVI